uniref:Uncharacterized protein n=1 Tax=Eutreptiella gymnastica TaxID=73025 RepID=A0A7S4CY14_9EUGL
MRFEPPRPFGIFFLCFYIPLALIMPLDPFLAPQVTVQFQPRSAECDPEQPQCLGTRILAVAELPTCRGEGDAGAVCCGREQWDQQQMAFLWCPCPKLELMTGAVPC